MCAVRIWLQSHCMDACFKSCTHDVVSVCSISKQSVKVFSVKIVFSTNPRKISLKSFCYMVVVKEFNQYSTIKECKFFGSLKRLPIIRLNSHRWLWATLRFWQVVSSLSINGKHNRFYLLTKGKLGCKIHLLLAQPWTQSLYSKEWLTKPI